MKNVAKLFTVFFAVFLLGCSPVEEVLVDEEEECEDMYGKGVAMYEDLQKRMDLEVNNLESKNKYLELSNVQLLEMLGDDAWIDFESEEVGFSFSYPASFGALKFAVYNCPLAGKEYSGSFENVNYIFGGGFVDCEYEGGSGNMLTYPGGDQILEWYGDDFIDYFEVDGGEFMYFKGSGTCSITDGYLDGDLVAATTIYKSDLQGGLIFRSYEREDDCNPTMRELKGDVSQEIFEDILETVKIY